MADAEHPVGQQQHAEVPPAAEAAPAAAAAPAVAAAATAAAAESQPQPAPAAGSKRPLEEAADGAAADGYDAAAKRQQVAPAAEPTAAPAAAPASAPAVTNPASVPRETVYRLVMDVVDTALIIGRGGATVRTIEQTTGGRVKRLQEPPGARQQTLVIWSQAKELPAPGRASLNTAQVALLDCVRRVVFQENAPPGREASVRLLINRTQEAGVLDNIDGLLAERPGVRVEWRRGEQLPACALDNDVVVELSGDKEPLVAVVEALSHVLREHPICERPGGAPPALVRAAPAGGGGGPPPFRRY